MTYNEALEYLNAPKYSSTRPGLETVRELMKRLGNPQDGLKYVHVAGTNGKGSTSAFIYNVLRCAGYKTGLYTSPYLEHFTERIRVNDVEIQPDDVARLTEKVMEKSDEMVADGMAAPSVFDLVTAVAFLYFNECNCDVVVLEVGLGGRLDATNIVRPEDKEVSVITKLGMDHMQFLGNTIEEIAHEKAGIICDGTDVVSTGQVPEARAVLGKEAALKCVNISFTDDKPAPELMSSNLEGQTFKTGDDEVLSIGMSGTYQLSNSLTALEAIRIMQKHGWNIPEDAVKEGLKKTRWNGRFELVHRNPNLIIDGAHNPNGVQSLADSLKAVFPGEKFTFITGVLSDKDYDEMYSIISPLAKRFLTVTPESGRALKSDELAKYLENKTDAEVIDCKTPETAVDKCLKDYSGDEICAFGSLYYIGEVRKYCKKLG